ncbi:MAG: DNA polymerase III subunit alpha [Proteobacteria bacterium]|nr:DNA polymerase III subunit alpha [Pseudomonadota bacterium]
MSQASSHSNFVHLHVHTHYSLLDGAIRPEQLFARAEEYRLPALALTDHGNLFGAIEFYKLAHKHGIKPIIGCECYMAPGSRLDKKRGAADETAFHLVLLARNLEGYRNLCHLVTRAYFEGFYYRPRIDREILAQYHEGLIGLSACLKGEVPWNLLQGRKDEARRAARELAEILGPDRFFVELQRNGLPEQERVNPLLIELARELSLPLVATNDCHYLEKKDARAHDILLALQTGKTMGDKDRMVFHSDTFYFRSPAEMAELFRDVPEAIENTVRIAADCNLELKLGERKFPAFPLPEGTTADEQLEQEARAGLAEKFSGLVAAGRVKPEAREVYEARLTEELRVIRKTGFAGYFLIVSDFVQQARSRGIPVGPGRGSAPGSLVAFALSITEIDPIAEGLLFERFLNEGRASLPDIDVDFGPERREEVYQYLTEKYGKDNVGHIITFSVMQAKAAIRDVGRVLEMPYSDVDQVAKLIPFGPGVTIKSALESEPRLKEMYQKEPRIRDLIETAQSVEGMVRHASTHAAGVVIGDRPLVDCLPLCVGQDDVVMTQYAMEDVEASGLIKFDLLGLKTLSIFTHTLRLIERVRGEKINLSAIPLDDAKSYELLAAGKTVGIFQFESSGMVELLTRSRPTELKDLVALNALYRPGPLGGGMIDDFIKRKKAKRTKTQYAIPQMKEILEETYGVIVYQEQVMKIANRIGGFSLTESDRLRKAMAKKKQEEMEEARPRFVEGAVKNKFSREEAEKLFEDMSQFSKYAFNKCHSAAYALIAYQSAYLKANYPVFFLAALLSADMDDSDKVLKNLNECKAMGIKVLPPEANESEKDFMVVGENTIRFGLSAVKNVGEMAVEAIIESRSAQGKFTSIFDFCERVDLRKVNHRVVENLIKCGTFDGLGMNRATTLDVLDSALDAGSSFQREREQGQESLFARLRSPRPRQADGGTELPEWPRNELLRNEKEALGFYITGHPLLDFSEEMNRYVTHQISELAEVADHKPVRVGGMISGKREVTTRQGKRMGFVTLEGLDGFIEVVVFAESYAKFLREVQEDEPILVTGKLERNEDRLKILDGEICPLRLAGQKICQRIHFQISAPGINGETFRELKRLIQDHPGRCQTVLHLSFPNQTEAVIALPESLRAEAGENFFTRVREIFGGGSVTVQ